jgi:phosphatidylserine/phosphatidylglycerophosphate/cardiolipin synthase-like enzyme
LAQKAQHTIDIAAFFVDLTGGEAYPPVAGGDKGDEFFNDILDAVKRGVKVNLLLREYKIVVCVVCLLLNG